MSKYLLAAALVPLTVTTAAAQMTSFAADARTLWKGTVANINQAADELSEEMYKYRPTPDVRTFGELFAHVAGSQNMYCAMALGEKVPGEGDVEEKAKTKAEIVAALKQSNAYCEKAYALPDASLEASVDIFGQQRSRYYTLIANATHDGEHYGNIVTYTRLNKLVPPSSRPRSQ